MIRFKNKWKKEAIDINQNLYLAHRNPCYSGGDWRLFANFSRSASSRTSSFKTGACSCERMHNL